MEEELFEAMRKVADWFNWDLSKREDPERNDIVEGNVWPHPADEMFESIVGMVRCDRCDNVGHNTADHDSVTLERVFAEIREHNRRLGAE